MVVGLDSLVVAPSLNFASCNSRLRAPQPSTPPKHPLIELGSLVTGEGRFFLGGAPTLPGLELTPGDWFELLSRGAFHK